MTTNWTEAWAEQQASPDLNIVELYSVELIHPEFLDVHGAQTSVRAVNDVRDHDLPLEATAPLNPSATVTFTAIPFQVPWFETEEGKVPELVIRIDNIGREVIPYLDNAVTVNAPVTVIFRCHLYNIGTGAITSGMDPVTFAMREVSVNENYVEGKASPADLANLQFPLVVYDVLNYPALVQ